MWHLEEPNCTEEINGRYARHDTYTDEECIWFCEKLDNELMEKASKPYIVTYLGIDGVRYLGDQLCTYYDGKWWWTGEELLTLVRVPILAWTDCPPIYEGEDTPEWRIDERFIKRR